jgi:hypothetical protein
MVIITCTKTTDVTYTCNLCNYNCAKTFLWNQHKMTAKHMRKHLETDGNQKYALDIQCETCNKQFKNRSGLWKHKKLCFIKKPIVHIDEPNNDYKDLVVKLITENQEIRNMMLKENQELRKQLIDQGKQITGMIPLIGNNNNNIKNKFNVQIFLNEKCKDALSIDEFIEQIDVSMKNLLATKDHGLGVGLSNIIIDNMNKLSLYERPMHCTDKKRETLYIKNNEWGKDKDNQQITDLLKKVENKQIKGIKKWTDEHPNFLEDEKLKEEYMNLIRGCTSSIEACKEKAIKKVCENVYITE